MEVKKSKKASLENKKKSFFLFGLLTSLGIILMAFEWANHDINYSYALAETTILEQEPIYDITRIEKPKPKTHNPVKREEVKTDYEIDSTLKDIDEELESQEKDDNKDVVIDTATKFVEPGPVLPEPPVDVPQVMPEYPGGTKGLYSDLGKLIPKNNTGVGGKVYVEFVIEKDGYISNVKLKRGIHERLDNDVLKAVIQLKKWSPGKQNYRPVRVRMVLPVRYVIKPF